MKLLIDFKYIEDPKNIWGQAKSQIDTITRTGFKNDYPNIYKLLENFYVTSEIQSHWTYQLVIEEVEGSELAEDWIKNNFKTTDKWLSGVVDKRGESAAITLRENLN